MAHTAAIGRDALIRPIAEDEGKKNRREVAAAGL